jgi:hypothetical protein
MAPHQHPLELTEWTRFSARQANSPSQGDAARASEWQGAGGALLEFPKLRDVSVEPPQRALAAAQPTASRAAVIISRPDWPTLADNERGDPLAHAVRREVAMLRAMLADRDRRIAEQDAVIDDLHDRLTVLVEPRSGGGLRRAFRVLGNLLDTLAEMTDAPPTARPSPQRRGTGDAAEASTRASAEKALLDLIAHHHRRWVGREAHGR